MTQKLQTTADLLCRNAIDVINKEDLLCRLKKSQETGKPLRVKAGFDPSAPDIHLGHTVLLRKLAQFQEFGHTVCLIIGDYTAMIGDPTGRTQTRPALSREEVLKNAATYKEQAFKILDEKKTIVYQNNDWFSRFSLQDFLEKIATRYTVARILERDDFEKRMAADQPISMRELMYPLLQGYDSVEVKADIELGGSDQKFNLLVGRDLQRTFGQEPQIVMTLPLLVGLDGTQKMSKSYGNYIGVTDSPKDMFGKLMSIPDSLMPMYVNLLTTQDWSQIDKEITTGKLHPKDAKINLAVTTTASFYDMEQAQNQAAEFNRVFSSREDPENAELLNISEEKVWVVDLIRRTGAVRSGADARRLLEQGAVWIGGKKISDQNAQIDIQSDILIKVGKHKFYKIKH